MQLIVTGGRETSPGAPGQGQALDVGVPAGVSRWSGQDVEEFARYSDFEWTRFVAGLEEGQETGIGCDLGVTQALA